MNQVDRPPAPAPAKPGRAAIPERCPVCGTLGTLAPANTADAARRLLCVEYRCAGGHAWTVEYPR